MLRAYIVAQRFYNLILMFFQLDLIIMEECDGYREILHIMDHYTHFHWLAPLHSKTPQEVHAALRTVFAMTGVPDKLLADNGGEFCHLESIVAEFPGKCQVIHGGPYEPECQGMVERYHQEAEARLGALSTVKWYMCLPLIASEFRSHITVWKES